MFSSFWGVSLTVAERWWLSVSAEKKSSRRVLIVLSSYNDSSQSERQAIMAKRQNHICVKLFLTAGL